MAHPRRTAFAVYAAFAVLPIGVLADDLAPRLRIAVAPAAAPVADLPTFTKDVLGEALGGQAGRSLDGTWSFAPPGTHVRVEAAVQPRREPDGPWPLVVRLVPDAGWHLYRPASSSAVKIGQGSRTVVAVPADQASRVARVAVIAAEPAQTGTLAASGAVLGPIVLELLVSGAAHPDPLVAAIGFQACQDHTCDLPRGLRLSIVPPREQPADGTVACEETDYDEAGESPLTLELPAALAAVPVANGAAVVTDTAVGPAPAPRPGAPAPTLAKVLLMGLVGGLLLNLMPCVLPVLGLKLMAFAQQSGRARQEVFVMNLWYCAGVFAVFFVLATASVAANLGLARANLAWGEQFTSTAFNVTMIAIVFAFALSFLGTWELPVPGFIGEQAGHVQTREGPVGSFLKGVLSTVLATPCSGPYLGTVFGFTLTQPTAVTYAVFGAIAAGMALPYLVVGVFPGLVRFLPRPGPWMVTFKEAMGFVMLGTVAYLFTFLHKDWFVFAFTLLVGIWAACWWVGRAQERTGVVAPGRWLQAALIPAVVGLAAFWCCAPLATKVIDWEQPFSRARLAELRGSGATVMVDFSANWCPTCKLNLVTAIETNRVREALAANDVVPVLADWTDGSAEIKEVLESLGSRSIPLLAVFPPARPGDPLPEPIVLRDLITESQVLEALRQAGPSRVARSALRSASAAPATAGH